MDKGANREKVFKTLQEALESDRAKTNVLKISDIGLVEMTRKRVRESIGRLTTEVCPTCDGRGHVRSKTTMAFDIMREVQRAAGKHREDQLVVSCHPDVAKLLQGPEREALRLLMMKLNKSVTVRPQPQYHVEQYDLHAKWSRPELQQAQRGGGRRDGGRREGGRGQGGRDQQRSQGNGGGGAAGGSRQGGRLRLQIQARLAALREQAESLPGVRRFVRAVLLLAHGFRGEAITLRASALTYLTLFSLVPLLAVVYSVLDLFTGEAQMRERLQSYINAQLGIGAGAAISGALTSFTSKATIPTLGAIGFAALFVTVLSLLWNIESAFNHIYAVKKPRSPLQRLLKYWSFLTLGPIFLSASLYISWTISRMQEAHGHPGHSELLHGLAAFSSVFITYAGLAFLYKVIPNARVSMRAALAAALTAGTAWEIAKFLFAWGSSRMVQLHKIYGSVAVLPITLTWIYISWLIALIGCRLCFALDASRKPEPHPALQGAASREAFTARLMIALVQLHREGHGPVPARVFTRELEASSRMVHEGLHALAALGLAVEAKQGGWVPGRDPARITLAQLRAAARATLRYPAQEADPLSLRLAQAFARAEGAAESALGESLESFLRRTDPGLEATPEPEGLKLAVAQGAQKPA